jgi:hypothetical protein
MIKQGVEDRQHKHGDEHREHSKRQWIFIPSCERQMAGYFMNSLLKMGNKPTNCWKRALSM